MSIRPTSVAQSGWAVGDPLPDLEEVRDGIWSLALSMPDGHIHMLFITIVEDADRNFHLIDSGWDTDENWDRLVAALAAIGGSVEQVASVTATHLHVDHLGMAARVRAASGARIGLHRFDQAAITDAPTADSLMADVRERLLRWGVPRGRRAELEAVVVDYGERPDPTASLLVDRIFEDGDSLDLPGRSLTALHTPGHTSGHLSIVDEADGQIMTGDHVLPTIYSGLGLGAAGPTNPMADYLESLDRVRPFDGFEVLPGHGYRFRGLVERGEAIAAHHLTRSREVFETHEQAPDATVWQIASAATWSAGWQNLRGFYLVSALQQIEMHAEFVRSDVGRRRLQAHPH